MALKIPGTDTVLGKEEEEAKEPIVAKYEEIFTSYQTVRSKYTRQWYINDNFFDGNHFIFFRKSTGTIDRVSPPRGTIYRSVPKASKQIEAIQNLVLANEPRWMTYPAANPDGVVDVNGLKDAQRVSRRRRLANDDRLGYSIIEGLSMEDSMDTVTVSPKYQVVIPRDIRQSMKIRPGQKVRVFEYEDRNEMIPIRKMRQMRGFLKGIDTTVHREKDRA